MADEKPDQRDDAFTIPDSIQVKLKRPLKKAAAGGEVLETLTFRPPTVGEMKEVAKLGRTQGEEEAGVRMLVLLNDDGLTKPEIERMNFIDLQLCLEALDPFVKLLPRSSAES